MKDIKFPDKVRETHKIDKKVSISISVFSYKNKEKHPIYVEEKFCEEKHVTLLLMEEKAKNWYNFIKDFNIFM